MKKDNIPSGCLTAMETPFNSDGTIDLDGLEMNIEFQISQGVKGIVPVGTTGESPTLTSKEHIRVIAKAIRFVEKRVFVLAGCGSNSTKEAIHFTAASFNDGCDGVLLVDCYYNGPSSLELREEYYRPIIEEFPDSLFVPYIIPKRTGCALEPGDLAILAWQYPCLGAVKEARGDFNKMKEIRGLAPPGFKIFSGDDDKTYEMMLSPEISASGVISVISNIAPAAVQEMPEKILAGRIAEAKQIREALNPLFEIVTVSAQRKEKIQGKEVVIIDKFRNPDAIKTIMQGLGMPAGFRRRPLGKMTVEAVEQVRNALRTVWNKNPWILDPIEKFYNVSISDRLTNDKIWTELSFKSS